MACAKPSAHITHTHRQAPATLTSSLSTHLTAITHSTTTTAPNSCHHQAVPSAHASALRPHRFQPRPQFQRRFQQTAQRRQLVVSRTSAEWWDDEEEFDAVAGEVILPKTLYVLGVPPPEEAASSAPTMEEDPQKQQEEAEEWVVEYTAEILSGHLPGKSATGAFSGQGVADTADRIWEAWGASGPPYFKTVKRRGALDEIMMGKGSEAAEALLKEIFSQNWRVELDAGLGVNLNPREHIVIVCTRPASNLLLETMGFARLGQSGGGVVVSKVELDGWNTSDMRPEDLKPLENWRDLKPRLTSRQYSHPPL